MKVRLYNDTLNPVIWDNLKLNPEIKEKLLQIGKDFYADTETDAPLKDILFVGSLANYNWSDTSDFDVHVVINFKDVDENVELVEKLVNALKSKWNDDHDIHVKQHNVEVYIQDVTKENRSTGVYSLMQDKWLSEPKKENIKIDKEKNAFGKSIFTLCDYRSKDKCPPWTIQSTKMLHDKKKKTISHLSEVVEFARTWVGISSYTYCFKIFTAKNFSH